MTYYCGKHKVKYGEAPYANYCKRCAKESKIDKESKFKKIVNKIIMSELSTNVKKKYSELLKLGKEAIDAIKIPFEVRKAEKDLEKEIIILEQQIAEQELKIQEAKGTRPLNLRTVLDAIDAKDLKERDLRLAKELQSELF